MPSSRTLVVGSFAALYFIWGSTYVAIRLGLGSLPPFLLCGTRYVVAGAILLGLARRAGVAPTARHWWAAVLVGPLLCASGNGLMSWTQRSVASGTAALVFATVPLWLALLQPAAGLGRRPGWRAALGWLAGLAGVGLLVLPGRVDERLLTPTLAVVLLASAGSWAVGSVLSVRLPRPSSVLAASGVHVLVGGVAALAVSCAAGEWATFDASAVTPVSLAAWAYLVGPGSVVALSAYVWLLRRCSPAVVGTYAFVNPVVAVLLGAVVLGEPVTATTGLSTLLVVAAVVLVLRDRAASRTDVDARPEVAPSSDSTPEAADAPARAADVKGAAGSCKGATLPVRSGLMLALALMAAAGSSPRAAARAEDRGGAPTSLDVLHALHDPDEDVRLLAAWLLADVEEAPDCADVAAALLSRVQDREERVGVRVAAAVSLRRWVTRGAISPDLVAAVATDPAEDWRVRAAALETWWWSDGGVGLRRHLELAGDLPLPTGEGWSLHLASPDHRVSLAEDDDVLRAAVHADSRVRRLAVVALSLAAGTDPALALLVALAADPAPDVAALAVAAALGSGRVRLSPRAESVVRGRALIRYEY